jgi:hypothetical protein
LIRQRANQLLLAAILSLYGAVTVGGPALHALPGLGHDTAGLTSQDRKAPACADPENASTHDCPICHFHAQGQVIANPDAGPCIEVVRIRPATDPPLTAPLAAERLSIPRAPPLV